MKKCRERRPTCVENQTATGNDGKATPRPQSSSEGVVGNPALAEIIDLQEIQSLVDDFYELVPIPMAIVDLKGQVLVGKGWQDVCTSFHRVHAETHANCLESDLKLTLGIAPGEFRLYKCKNNMWDVATPIMVGGLHLGNLFSGQFFFDDEPLDYELFRSQARRYGFDEQAYLAALERAPRLSRELLGTGMRFFTKLTALISKLSYSNLKLAAALSERDSLMEQLRRTHDQLEKRVSERTEELTATVALMREEIGERERMKASLLRLNRLYAVLSETDQAIIRAQDRASLFHDFCRIAVDQGGFLLSWVGLLDQAQGRVCQIAAAGATGYLDKLHVSTVPGAASNGPTGMSIHTGTYYICNDFQNDACTAPWHDRGRAFGINASASVALREEGRVIGTLTLYAAEKDFFDLQHIQLLMKMGADISFALDNLLREASRRQMEQALREETLERLRAVEALREKERIFQQQTRLAAMGEMINNIAHQWRQPLNVLGLLVQQMQLFYDLGSFDQEYLNATVHKSMDLINHMSQTIEDFSNFFKPDKEKTEFDIHEVAARTVALVQDSFANQQIRIVYQAHATPSAFGYANEYSQVLLNILMNARDALLDRRPEQAKVTVTIDRVGERAVVTIADNAGGIPEEIMGKIFEPYFTTKEPDKGTGVGLYMSKTIIEKSMNGSLTARNSAEGAEFRIEV